MAIFEANINTSTKNFTARYDLEAALPNEKTIISYFNRSAMYEPDVAEIMFHVLAEGDTVVDVGANAGFFTILMAHLVGASGKIISFEPGANTVNRLKNNIKINNLANITLIERPVSNCEEEVTFHLNSDDSGGNALWDPAAFPGNTKSQAAELSQTMTSATLDNVFQKNELPRPKLIKIDTEGAEQKVLEGARRLISGSAIPFIIAELHDFGLEKMGNSQASLRELMGELGYSTFVLYHNGKLPKYVPPTTKIKSTRFINILFSTQENVGRYWPVELHEPE
jgi:FkbM family methyltransferase